ncbi:hypothetical protein TNIN_196571 [Trichonephila inaurata madagascariensis]|uniref:Uncharacterized protein n=1 Tax=Trichonephila inaurata madagascariensis TaxID=2747483 RepID=A0A8X6YLB3_9ARAC|nr:hypothetical protein TNIN_196571 [Trichonephila inaurata madagascariensis]
MHLRNTSTLSLEKTALLHKLEESNLEKVDKLVKLEKKYEILQETFKITEKRLVEKEIECASLTEKILIVNALTESNDHPKTSMSTKKQEIKPSKRKTKKLKFSGRNVNKTSDSDENQAIAKEKNDLLRQIDFLNSIILDTKLKEPNKSIKTSSLKNANYIYIKKANQCQSKEPSSVQDSNYDPSSTNPKEIRSSNPMMDRKWKRFAYNILDFLSLWSAHFLEGRL